MIKIQTLKEKNEEEEKKKEINILNFDYKYL